MKWRKTNPVSFVIHALNRNREQLEDICERLEGLGFKRGIDFQATCLPPLLDYREIAKKRPNPKYDPELPDSDKNPKRLFVVRELPLGKESRYRLLEYEIEKKLPREIPITFAIVPENRYGITARIISGYEETVDYLDEKKGILKDALVKSRQ